MVKSNIKKATAPIKIPIKILIAQPKPEGSKSPYYDLAVKHGLALDFYPFINVEGIPSKEFRKQKRTYSSGNCSGFAPDSHFNPVNLTSSLRTIAWV